MFVWWRECTGTPSRRARNRTNSRANACRIYNVENARTLSLLIVLLAACAASPPPEPQPWRVEVTSSGGIAGKGAGSMVADSEGTVTVTTIARKTCPGRLSETELRRLADAIAKAKPEEWQPLHPEDICCDRIEWSLALEIGGKTHTFTWIDDPKLALPPDLRTLTQVLGDIRVEHIASCR